VPSQLYEYNPHPPQEEFCAVASVSTIAVAKTLTRPSMDYVAMIISTTTDTEAAAVALSMHCSRYR